MGKPYHRRTNLVSVMLEVVRLGVHVGNEEGDNVTQEDNLSRYQGMIFYAAGHEFGMYSKSSEEVSESG